MGFEQEAGRENIAVGILGALLGALACMGGAGLLVWLGIGAYDLYFVMTVGMATGFLPLLGYRKLAGSISKPGAVISCGIALIATYGAFHTTVAVELARETGMSFSRMFLSIPQLLRYELIDPLAFWGRVVLVYITAILGAAPLALAPFSPPESGHISRQGGAPVKEPPALAEAEFFPPDKHMIAKPFYGGLATALLFGTGGLLLLKFGDGTAFAFCTGMALLFCALHVSTDALKYSVDSTLLFVRVERELWRVYLPRLNEYADRHFTDSPLQIMKAVHWHRLSPEEQERAKQHAFELIAEISSACESPADRPANPAVMSLPDFTVYQESKWSWKGTCLGRDGKYLKGTIHKSFPGLAPTPECQPAEQPLPFRWHVIALSLVFVLLLGGLGLMLDLI